MQLSFGAVPGVNTSGWTNLLDALLNAIAIITPKELAFRLNIKGTYLSDAIAKRDRKAIKAEWIPVIIEMAPDQVREAILLALASPYGYEVVRRRELSPEERLERAERAVVERFGRAGAELVEELRR